MKNSSGDMSNPPQNPDYDLDQDLDKDLNGDTLREECGVFGIFGHPDAAAITALGLHALQHRGQEAAGIVTYDNGRFHSERRLGLVGDTFSRADVIERLPGNTAVGHVRYSTTGGTILRNVQPLFAELNAGGFAVAHNGNLTNGLTLRRELVRHGAMMQSTTDTEVILHLVAQSKRGRFIERYIEALRAIEGAYALVSLTNKKLVGARDPLGIRPLVLGELDGCPILASETCALDIIGAKYIRDIEPGEVIVFDDHGQEIHKPFLVANSTPEPGKERLQTIVDRERFDDTTKCILCAACTSSCPVFWTDGQYFGPAAIVNAHRFIFDSRDDNAAVRLDILNDKEGVWRCRTTFNCSEACPRGIQVTKAIAEVKQAVLRGV